MKPWRLSNAEWRELGPLLQEPSRPTKTPGRPRIEDNRAVAEACLYRHFHARKSRYRTFGWNLLPKEIGVSPSTANRRFRAWSADGSWNRFWHALLVLRHEPLIDFSTTVRDEIDDSAIKNQNPMDKQQPPKLTPEPWLVERTLGRFPVGDILPELERAYLFFNAYFFGKTLPVDIALTIERARRRACLGYFCAQVWSKGDQELGHIALHASLFGKGSRPVLEVLLHEMVHLRNAQHGIRDCHPRNQYHNRNFRDMAILSGLSCGARDPDHGYAITALDDAGLQAVTAFEPSEDLFHWLAR